LPNKYFQAFIEIEKIYRKHNVFLEYAVPMMLHGLDEAKNFEFLEDGYNWKARFMYENYPLLTSFYHSAKLSYVESKPLQRRLFCKYFVNDKIRFI
jgi:hypothetical protein